MCIHIHIYVGIMVKVLTADDGTLTPTDDSARAPVAVTAGGATGEPPT